MTWATWQLGTLLAKVEQLALRDFGKARYHTGYVPVWRHFHGPNLLPLDPRPSRLNAEQTQPLSQTSAACPMSTKVKLPRAHRGRMGRVPFDLEQHPFLKAYRQPPEYIVPLAPLT
ncbi:hypothetical protein IAQ61_006603 [Plenodomus lingam]|uniref:uncharacterized protein n=1 Tax=Leptosphaeria maculans TaxID=5022 RepID=UPI00332C8CF2|nr:hypothetical protein IAQ61_006603 [Plenodomus lingam]